MGAERSDSISEEYVMCIVALSRVSYSYIHGSRDIEITVTWYGMRLWAWGCAGYLEYVPGVNLHDVVHRKGSCRLGRESEQRAAVAERTLACYCVSKLMSIHALNSCCIARVPHLVPALLSEPEEERYSRKADVDEVSTLEIYSQY